MSDFDLICMPTHANVRDINLTKANACVHTAQSDVAHKDKANTECCEGGNKMSGDEVRLTSHGWDNRHDT